MPATTPLPTVDGLLSAFSGAVRAAGGAAKNTRRGAGYDALGGPAAILWARQAIRDRDLFRQNLVETATGYRLETIVERRYGVPRVQETFGTGTAVFERPVAGSDGTLYRGTRIEVLGDSPRPEVYAIAEDTGVDAATTWLQVPVRATRPGPGTGVLASGARIRLADAVFDDTFSVAQIRCDAGTAEEPAATYLSRARQTKLDNRVGYHKRIVQACIDAGAATVVLLDAGVFGEDDDFGVSHVYVADAGYTTSEALLDACFLAVDRVHVAGCDMQVLGMEVTPLTSALTLKLWDSPGAFDQVSIRRRTLDALLAEFGRRKDFWLFRHDALRGAVVAASPEVQDADIATTPDEPAADFVPVLPRYTLAGTDVTITLQGP
ncbi:hypothetical protein [Sorangium sp. So ce233]|uniref:hypothetical protein n=1 Tax=Sorangium sp. So ce233 TaxID=3133290 RepID=UPI003F63AC2A